MLYSAANLVNKSIRQLIFMKFFFTWTIFFAVIVFCKLSSSPEKIYYHELTRRQVDEQTRRFAFSTRDLCCTVGARVLHSWYQIAVLLVPDSCTFLVLLFEILYMTGQMGFKTDFSFDSVCILNDSGDSGDQWSS